MAILVHLPALCIVSREEYGTFHGQSGLCLFLRILISLISLWQQFNTILTWKYISTAVIDELNEERTLLATNPTLSGDKWWAYFDSSKHHKGGGWQLAAASKATVLLRWRSKKECLILSADLAPAVTLETPAFVLANLSCQLSWLTDQIFVLSQIGILYRYKTIAQYNLGMFVTQCCGGI